MKFNIKKDKDIICIYNENNELIEEYSLERSITFEKLMGKLLSLNMSEKINLITEKGNSFNEDEQKLLKLIETIVIEYNQRVDELKDYKG